MDYTRIKKKTFKELLENEEFKKNYTTLYNVCHKSTDGNVHFETQVQFFKNICGINPKILECTTLSVYTSFLDLAYHGLSIEPISKAQSYLLPRSANIGTKAVPKWEQRLIHQISPYGELYLRMKTGIIKYADNPKIVYEGDIFQTINGIPNHEETYKSEIITHAYIKITRYDGSVEYKIFSMSQFLAMRDKSKDPNGVMWTGGINGQPQIGMIEAKVIKHSFATYPRLKLGLSTVLSSTELDDMEAEAAYADAMTSINEEIPQAIVDENTDDKKDSPTNNTEIPIF